MPDDPGREDPPPERPPGSGDEGAKIPVPEPDDAKKPKKEKEEK
jgi:hypothetical protein